MSQGRRRSPLPPNWRSIRQVVLQRDNHTCQRCGRTNRPLEVHHAVHHADHRVEALLTLCKPCHATQTAIDSNRSPARQNRRKRPYTEVHPGLNPTFNPDGTSQ